MTEILKEADHRFSKSSVQSTLSRYFISEKVGDISLYSVGEPDQEKTQQQLSLDRLIRGFILNSPNKKLSVAEITTILKQADHRFSPSTV